MKHSKQFMLALAIMLIALLVPGFAMAEPAGVTFEMKFDKATVDVDLTRDLVNTYGALGINQGNDVFSVSFTATSDDYFNLSWSSSDESVASIWSHYDYYADDYNDDLGKWIYRYTGYASLTPHKPGTTTITVKDNSGKLKDASFVLNLKEVPVTAIEFDKETPASFIKGAVRDLNDFINIVPANATYGSDNLKVTWSSSDTSIATVTSKGYLRAKRIGKVTVSATMKGAAAPITKEFDITNKSGEPLTDVKFSQKTFKMYSGDKEALGDFIITDPESYTASDLDWTSSDENVAIVNENGTLTAVKPSDKAVTITVASADGLLKDTCTVEVIEKPIKSLKLKADKAELIVGKKDSVTVGFTLEPADANTEKLGVMVDDNDIAAASINREKNTVTVTTFVELDEDEYEYYYSRIPGTATVSLYDTDTGNVFATLTATVKANAVTQAKFTNSAYTVNYGNEKKLPLKVFPSDAKYDELNWVSSDDAIVSVSGGYVTANAPGTATITATFRNYDGTQVTASCDVTVSDHKLEKIEFKKAEYTAKLRGEGYSSETNLYYKVTPADADFDLSDDLIFESSDDSIVTITGYSKKYVEVEAVKPGTAEISIRSVATGNVLATTKVVVKPVAIKKISFNKTKVQLQCLDTGAGNSYTLKLSITPKDAYVDDIVWETSDTRVAFMSSVDGDPKSGSKYNTIYAVGAGTCEIYARVYDAEKEFGKATAKFTVVPRIPKLQMSETSATVNMIKGVDVEPIQLEVTDADSGDVMPVKWKSSNKKVAKVDAKGVVTVVGKGKATITATHKRIKTDPVTFKITVNQKKVTKITLNKTKLSMKVGDPAQLTWTVKPSNAYNNAVKVTSSDNKVVKVDADGNLTAVKKGKATITVTAADGSKKKATCKVTVK